MFKKILLIVFLLGLILTVSGLILSGGNFKKIADAYSYDSDFEYVEKSGSEEVKVLELDIFSNNVVIQTMNEDGYKIEYYESSYDTKEVTFENNVLTIVNNRTSVIRFFTFGFLSTKYNTINIYLSKTFIGEVNIRNTSGNNKITNLNVSSLSIYVKSGNILLEDVSVQDKADLTTLSGNMDIERFTAKSLTTKTSSGIVEIEDAVISGETSLRASSGVIKVEESTLSSIVASTSSGNIYIIDVECGNVDASASSGNIKAHLYGNSDDYKIDARVSSGKIYYNGMKLGGDLYDPTGSKMLKLKTSSGNIEIEFKNK